MAEENLLRQILAELGLITGELIKLNRTIERIDGSVEEIQGEVSMIKLWIPDK